MSAKMRDGITAQVGGSKEIHLELTAPCRTPFSRRRLHRDFGTNTGIVDQAMNPPTGQLQGRMP
ncbi:hypothetical protein D3C77_765080 [compost metagenome]